MQAVKKPFAKNLLLCLSRVPGILFVLFTSNFSFNGFDLGSGLREPLLAFFMHLLLPATLLAILAAHAWRWEWVGAVGTGQWALSYPFAFRDLTSWPIDAYQAFLRGWLFCISRVGSLGIRFEADMSHTGMLCGML